MLAPQGPPATTPGSRIGRPASPEQPLPPRFPSSVLPGPAPLGFALGSSEARVVLPVSTVLRCLDRTRDPCQLYWTKPLRRRHDPHLGQFFAIFRGQLRQMVNVQGFSPPARPAFGHPATGRNSPPYASQACTGAGNSMSPLSVWYTRISWFRGSSPARVPTAAPLLEATRRLMAKRPAAGESASTGGCNASPKLFLPVLMPVKTIRRQHGRKVRSTAGFRQELASAQQREPRPTGTHDWSQRLLCAPELVKTDRPLAAVVIFGPQVAVTIHR